MKLNVLKAPCDRTHMKEWQKKKKKKIGKSSLRDYVLLLLWEGLQTHVWDFCVNTAIKILTMGGGISPNTEPAHNTG